MAARKTQAVLKTFEEKANRLENSSLMRFMSSDGWKTSWDFEADRSGDDAKMPELEHLEAYILNLRFFVQDNELTSLRNIAALYKKECKDAELLKQFGEVRDAMNGALDRELWFRFNNQAMTYRTLFLGMIYTRFAHSSKGKHELFEQMVAHPFGYMMAMNEFLKCIGVIHAAVVVFNKLNS